MFTLILLLSVNQYVFCQVNADFSSNVNNGCNPVVVQFTDLSTGGPVSWFWDFRDGSTATSNSVTHLFSEAGRLNITLSATYGNGNCVKDIKSIVQTSGYPEAQFWFKPERPSIKNPSVRFSNFSVDAYENLWIFTPEDSSFEENLVYTFDGPGYYDIMLIVKNQFGCPDTIVKKIFISPKVLLNVPTAFSPNGDGINDLFRFWDAGMIQQIEFKIFDRWGVKMYETTDPNSGWDDTYKGKPQPMDTYVYYIIANMADSENNVFQKGEFVLIR